MLGTPNPFRVTWMLTTHPFGSALSKASDVAKVINLKVSSESRAHAAQ